VLALVELRLALIELRLALVELRGARLERLDAQALLSALRLLRLGLRTQCRLELVQLGRATPHVARARLELGDVGGERRRQRRDVGVAALEHGADRRRRSGRHIGSAARRASPTTSATAGGGDFGGSGSGGAVT
jgi:uncharacterized membrane protein YgcG